MDVQFRNNYGEFSTIGTAETPEEVSTIIKDFLDKHHYESFYWRWVGTENNLTMVDVGSHTEFFFIDAPVETFLDGKDKRTKI